MYGQDVEITQDIYDVIIEKDGKQYHQFYNKDGQVLELSEDEFNKGFALYQLGNEFDENSGIINNIYEIENSEDKPKSITELEKEQVKEIAKTLEMPEEEISKEFEISRVSDPEDIDKSQAKLSDFAALGRFEIDTSEMATSEQTIKKFLNIDSDRLFIVKINSEWKAFGVDENGTLHAEKNLQIASTTQSFNTVAREDSTKEVSRTPTIEFRRKDNPDYSLVVDRTTESKERAYVVAGNSRHAVEVESQTSPSVEAHNREMLERAAENPNLGHEELHEEIIDEDLNEELEEDVEEEIDPHEPSSEPEIGERHI